MSLQAIVTILQLALQLLVSAQNGTPAEQLAAKNMANQAIILSSKSLDDLLASSPANLATGTVVNMPVATPYAIPTNPTPAIITTTTITTAVATYNIKIISSPSVAGGTLVFQFLDKNGTPVLQPNKADKLPVILDKISSNANYQTYINASGYDESTYHYNFLRPIDPSLQNSAVLSVIFEGQTYEAPISFSQ